METHKKEHRKVMSGGVDTRKSYEFEKWCEVTKIRGSEEDLRGDTKRYRSTEEED